MKKGMLFGKFMPLHIGHLALINFALHHCDHLYIVLCYSDKEPIDGSIRKDWLLKSFEKNSAVSLIFFPYDEKQLPNSSVSSRIISKAWASAFKSLVPAIDIVFTSEDYGEYLAEFMSIRHVVFDKTRSTIPISASVIRNHPFQYWDYIADAAKPWFVKKVVLVGTESTGKSVLTERLAKHFETSFVPEMAREIIEKTNDCTWEDLHKIAALHAKAIESGTRRANKLLLVDTDLVITKSYSQYLFNKELIVEPWIEQVNKFDLYLFMEADCKYIQDGTRLSPRERDDLSDHHKKAFEKAHIPLVFINGNWEERFERAIDAISNFITKTAANK